MNTPGRKFLQAMAEEKPLQLIGTINAYVALMAKQLGYKALYLSGAGVANASYGLPDIGITTLDNVLEDVRRITSAVDLPLIVDIDTGWGDQHMIARSVRSMIQAGAAGVHLEDQTAQKRCGHLEGKTLVSTDEMCERIKAAVKGKSESDFLLIARTDALAVEGFEATVARGIAYRDAGADIIFPEAFHTLEQYKTLKDKIGIPILANITEFGKTPLFTLTELRNANVDIALYPLTVTRSMNFAALNIMKELREKGTQKHLLQSMQTRNELYEFLNY